MQLPSSLSGLLTEYLYVMVDISAKYMPPVTVKLYHRIGGLAMAPRMTGKVRLAAGFQNPGLIAAGSVRNGF